MRPQVCSEITRGDRGLLVSERKCKSDPRARKLGTKVGRDLAQGGSRRGAGARTNFKRFKNSKGQKILKPSLPAVGRRLSVKEGAWRSRKALAGRGCSEVSRWGGSSKDRSVEKDH